MAFEIPKAVYQWNLTKGEGFESLTYSEQPLPQLGDSQVLVKCKLNYRDPAYLRHILTSSYSRGGIPQRELMHTIMVIITTNKSICI